MKNCRLLPFNIFYEVKTQNIPSMNEYLYTYGHLTQIISLLDINLKRANITDQGLKEIYF